VELLISEAVATIRLRLPEPRPENEPFRIVWQDQAHLPPIQGDPQLLGEALALVLENAVKYSPAGGAIHVAARVDESRLVISVQDRGIGIPPDQLRAVFERFHRVDTSLTRASGGMGLGLAICKCIVEMHGGTVWAESRLGVGSTFYLALPALPIASSESVSQERG
jgi:signal transduction histidine kinase